MIDAFLNSMEPPVSDDEDIDRTELFHTFTASKVLPFVETVIVACKPLSAVINRMCQLNSLEEKLGSYGVVGSIGIICLDREVRFDPAQLFLGFNNVIVLTHKFVTGGIDRCVSVVDSHACEECLIGMAACLMTQCLMSKMMCTILLAKHPSIHPSVEDAVNLAERLALLISLPFSQSEVVTNFNIISPINRKVPLYS